MHKIGLIGLGYVGLPLAVEFGKKIRTIGFDINQARIEELLLGKDRTLEVNSEEIFEAHHLSFTSDFQDIKDCNIYIVTVPTPIDEKKKPNLDAIEKSTKIVGRVLSVNDIVIYESTLYPGATEELCVPLLEKYSGLIYNKDFFCGYSPERINPGDKEHRLTNIMKITSGSNTEIAQVIDNLYKSIIKAGTYKASSIKVAEAAKVIENTQRDVNIALINELSLIFDKLDVDTEEVLIAAGTKWNFLPFRPGLVGGHCIGVDPYYLTHKAIEVGYYPKVILSGRELNDNMGANVVDRVIKLMKRKKITIADSNILIMGLSFKENCPDIRNTKVVDLIRGFDKYRCNVEVYDPWVDKKQAEVEYKITPIEAPKNKYYDSILLAVAHNDFKKLSVDEINDYGKNNYVLFDIKYLLKSNEVDGRL